MKTDNSVITKTAQEYARESLVKIGYFLEGIKQGKGNVLPLGERDLENLWLIAKWIEKPLKQ